MLANMSEYLCLDVIDKRHLQKFSQDSVGRRLLFAEAPEQPIR